jgi:hypothetical protein
MNAAIRPIHFFNSAASLLIGLPAVRDRVA